MTTPLHAQPDLALLDRLAQELKQLRALSVAVPTHSRCPEDKDALMGLQKEQIQAKLEKPDFIDRDGKWSYFFTSPVRPYQRGGGFPQLTFSFDSTGVVIHVICFYAR
jgi:hypothetical protein